MKKHALFLALACGLALLNGCGTPPALTSKAITVTVTPVEADVKIVTLKGEVIAEGKTVNRMTVLTIAVPSVESYELADHGLAHVEVSADGYTPAKKMLRYQDESAVNVQLFPTLEARTAELNKSLADAERNFLLEPAAAETKGSATLRGQAFLKTQGGDVKLGAGNMITALPVGSAANLMRELIDRGADMKTLSDLGLARYVATLRVVQADATGSFEFSQLPAGRYNLTTKIEWQIPSTYGLTTTGGLIQVEASVAEGETHRVMLTR